MAEAAARAATLVAVLLVLPGLIGGLATGPSRAAPGNPWYVQTVATERQAIYDMAVGDIDPKSPGDELVVTGGGGIVDEYARDTFSVKPIFVALKTQIGVAVGDVQSAYPGNEVVSVGQDYKVHVVHRETNGAWVAQTAWESVGSINGVTIGEFNASHPGKEIAVAGDKALMAILTEDKIQPTGWSVVVMPVQYVPITNMMCYSADVLSEYPGDEVMVGSFSGDVYFAHRWANNMTWNITSIWRDDYAILGVSLGPSLVPSLTGPILYIAGFGGRLTMLNYNGTNWTNTTIFMEKKMNPLYTVVPYDIDPRYPGVELIVSGIASNIHIVRYSGGNWTEETVIDPSGQDRLKQLYDMELGEFDSSHPGPELMMGGHLQDVLMLDYIEPTFDLVAMPSEQMAVSGHDAAFWISVKAIGYFTGDVVLSTDSGVTLSNSKARPGDLVKVTVHTASVPSERTISVNVTGRSLDLGTNRTVMLKVDALEGNAKGFDLEVSPQVQYTTPGFTISFVVRPVLINGWFGLLSYSLNTTMSLTSSHFDRTDSDLRDPAVASLTPSGRIGSGAYPVLLTVEGYPVDYKHFFRVTAVVVVVVNASGAKDFSLASYPQEARGVPGSTLGFDLSLSPISDFPDKVVLTVDGVPPGCTGTLTAQFLSLPTKVPFKLDLGKKTPESYYVMTFHASGGGKEHSYAVIVSVANVSATGDFALQVLPPTLMARPGGTVDFLVRVTGQLAPALTVVPGGPYQATISSGKDGNPEYRPMVVSIRSDAGPGVYKGTLVGRTDWEHNATFTLIISANLQEPDLRLVSSDLLVSPGQEWPTFRLDAVVNRELIVGKALRYTALGLGGDPPTYTSVAYNYSRNLSLPLPQLDKGTYLVLFVFYTPDNTYGKTLFGTVTMTSPVALLTMLVQHEAWTPRVGASNGLQVTVVNSGLSPARYITVEVLMDGKTIGRKVIPSVPAKGESAPVDFRWTADSGDHNITAIIFVDNSTTDGRVLAQPYTADLQIYPWSLKGPAISAALIFLVAAMLAYTVMSRSNAGAARTKRPRAKNDEEE
jgi:hypothetical protein